MPTSVFLTPTRNSCTLQIQHSVSIVLHVQSRKNNLFDDSFVFILLISLVFISGSLGHYADMQGGSVHER